MRCILCFRTTLARMKFPWIHCDIIVFVRFPSIFLTTYQRLHLNFIWTYSSSKVPFLGIFKIIERWELQSWLHLNWESWWAKADFTASSRKFEMSLYRTSFRNEDYRPKRTSTMKLLTNTLNSSCLQVYPILQNLLRKSAFVHIFQYHEQILLLFHFI